MNGRRWWIWLKFNLVGAIGVGVQISVLWLLENNLSVHYLVATTIAVEAAIVHNFVWHERWTWADRARAAPHDVMRRLIRFHLANGFISIGGNLAIMALLVPAFGSRYLVANIVAIAACSLFNFWASDRWCFALECSDNNFPCNGNR